MKPYVDAVVIVEGKSDEALLTSYFDVDILLTNGLDIKKEDIVGEALGAVVMGVDGEIEPAAVVMDGLRNFPQIGNLQEIVAMAKGPTVRAYLPAVFGEPIPRDESREKLLGSVLHVLLDPGGRVIRV